MAVGGLFTAILGELPIIDGTSRLATLLRTSGENIKPISPTTGAILETLGGGAMMVGGGAAWLASLKRAIEA